MGIVRFILLLLSCLSAVGIIKSVIRTSVVQDSSIDIAQPIAEITQRRLMVLAKDLELHISTERLVRSALADDIAIGHVASERLVPQHHVRVRHVEYAIDLIGLGDAHVPWDA